MTMKNINKADRKENRSVDTFQTKRTAWNARRRYNYKSISSTIF